MSMLTGYRTGPRVSRAVRIDASSADIEVDDFLTLGTAGYFQKAGAGDIVVCVAMKACSAGSADGDVVIPADFSQDTVYAVAPDAGTVSVALVGVTFDVGANNTANIDAHVDNSLFGIDVDTDNNLALVQIRPTIASVA